MAKAVPQNTLKKLICVVLLQLISPDRSQVDTDNTFLKALNVLMMRVLANSQKYAPISCPLHPLLNRVMWYLKDQHGRVARLQQPAHHCLFII